MKYFVVPLIRLVSLYSHSNAAIAHSPMGVMDNNVLNEQDYRSSYNQLWVQAGEPLKAPFSLVWAL